MSPRKPDSPDLKYLLGLFNSALLDYCFKAYLKSTKKVFSEIQARQVAELPIRAYPEDDMAQLVGLVDQMLSLAASLALCRTPQHASITSRQLWSVDQSIDQSVYQLYGLSAEEITLVESRR